MKKVTTYCDNCGSQYVDPMYKWQVKIIPPNSELRIVRVGIHDSTQDICGDKCMTEYVQKFLDGKV